MKKTNAIMTMCLYTQQIYCMVYTLHECGMSVVIFLNEFIVLVAATMHVLAGIVTNLSMKSCTKKLYYIL